MTPSPGTQIVSPATERVHFRVGEPRDQDAQQHLGRRGGVRYHGTVNTDQTVKIGLVQRRMGEGLDENLRRTIEGIHEAADKGANIVSTSELFRSRYFCQTEDHERFDLAEAIPGPTTEALAAVAKERGVVIVASLFERRAPGLFHNTAVVIDADGQAAGHLPQDAHPGRPALLREILLHPGRPGVPRLGHGVRAHRRARLLGPVVPGGRPPHGAGRRAHPVLPDRHRLAPLREGGVRRARSTTRGRRCSAATPSPTASSSPPPTASASSPARPTRSPAEPARACEFWGQSFVAGPDGQIVAARLARRTRRSWSSPADLHRVEVQRTHWPFLRDRRIDAYAGLAKRYLDEEVVP